LNTLAVVAAVGDLTRGQRWISQSCCLLIKLVNVFFCEGVGPFTRLCLQTEMNVRFRPSLPISTCITPWISG
jgi:hypothetical protein